MTYFYRLYELLPFSHTPHWVMTSALLKNREYFCHGTVDMQADWRSWTYGRAPNAIDISYGSLMCPSYTDTGPPFLRLFRETIPLSRI